jgi:hypothetical protein
MRQASERLVTNPEPACGLERGFDLAKKFLPGIGWSTNFSEVAIDPFRESIVLECILREFEEEDVVGPRLPPHDLRLGVAHGPIMLSRWWIDVDAAKNIGADIAIAVSVYVMTQSGGTSAAIAILRKLRVTLKRMTEEEHEVLRRMVSASGGDIFNVRIPEGTLLDSWPDEPQALLDLLDAMEKKGYLVRHRNGWTVHK